MKSHTDKDNDWIDRIARIPWWIYVALAIVVFLVLFQSVSLLEDRVPTPHGFVLPSLVLTAMLVLATVILLVLGAVSSWGMHRQMALDEVKTSLPSDDEFSAACEAGRTVASQGVVGLVLAGGGAKGAYQIGCWKALRACGLRHFGAIAGTSVGALNAVLVSQDDYDKAESIWYNMRFSRVMQLRWHALLAILIRVLLFLPYLGKLCFPDRFIPVELWRAVRDYSRSWREGEPVLQLLAGIKFYQTFLRRPDSTDIISQIVLAAVMLSGASAWWMLSLPLLTLLVIFVVAPLIAFLLMVYTSWFVAMLDQLSTRLVLATNQPLHQLLLDCVDVDRLGSNPQPLFVTLASLQEVTRHTSSNQSPVSPPTPAELKTEEDRPSGWWKKHVTGDSFGSDFVSIPKASDPMPVTTIEYVPSHFNLSEADSHMVHELILQSAGLPEIFPARRIGNDTYVDGGIVDNVPLTALADVPGQSALLVVALDAQITEAAVLKEMRANLERLGRQAPDCLPELILLKPSRPLGGFLLGTLDFGARRARALMQLGYSDTIRHLAKRSGE